MVKKRHYTQRATDARGRLLCGAADKAARVNPKLEGVRLVGHTHSTAVNAILCSQKGEETTAWRLFPKEIVYYGPAPGYVPYSDPGVPLARAIRMAVEGHLERFRERPKVVPMQNHGLPALDSTASVVENITAMQVKTARIILGICALGDPSLLTQQAVERSRTRPYEQHRRREWGRG
jgi:rhamnose utilization protein RhaD (predicted bifunctional aldolase and dehydrogenase)